MPALDHLPQIILNTKFPCCGGGSRIIALLLVPREKYTRTCRYCGQRWAVERRTIKEASSHRVDILKWERL